MHFFTMNSEELQYIRLHHKGKITIFYQLPEFMLLSTNVVDIATQVTLLDLFNFIYEQYLHRIKFSWFDGVGDQNMLIVCGNFSRANKTEQEMSRKKIKIFD